MISRTLGAILSVVLTTGVFGARSGEGVELGDVRFLPTPEHPVGFRGDWTGRYPAAEPPIRWSNTSNVVWKAPMPGASSAQPIIVGDKLFVVVPPVTVMCLDKRTGRTLWMRGTHAKAGDQSEQLAVRREVLVSNRWNQSVLNLQLRDLKNPARNPPATDEEIADLERRVAEAAKLPTIAAGGHNGALHLVNYSPCSDGQRVYVFLPSAETVCYDLDGNRLWLNCLQQETSMTYSTLASAPCLVGGRLIVHYGEFLRCFEAANGKVLWDRTDTTPNPKAGGNPIALKGWGSPVPGWRDGRTFLATGTGCIYDVSDGRQVHADRFSTITSPIFYDGMFCWVTHTVRPPAKGSNQAEAVWQCTKETGLAKYANYASFQNRLGHNDYPNPVWHDGLIYYARCKGMNGGVVIDATNGNVLAEARLPRSTEVRLQGDVYAGMILAGRYVFDTGEYGWTVVYELGREMKVAAINSIDEFVGGAAPVFEGGRMYLKGERNLYCIGRPEGTTPTIAPNREKP